MRARMRAARTSAHRYPMGTNRLADTSIVVLSAKRVTQLSNGLVCMRVRASPEEPGKAKVAIKESKRRLRPLTSRLVSAFGFADDILRGAPPWPNGYGTSTERTAIITLTR